MVLKYFQMLFAQIFGFSNANSFSSMNANWMIGSSAIIFD
jgi:hypothetical protein